MRSDIDDVTTFPRPDAANVCSESSGGTLATPMWSAAAANGKPAGVDSASMRAYDAVWTLARALSAVLAEGDSADDGAAVMASLLGTSFNGISGLPANFDRVLVGEKVLWPTAHTIAKKQVDGGGGVAASLTEDVLVGRMVPAQAPPNALELVVDAAVWNLGSIAPISEGEHWLGEAHGDGNMPTLAHSAFYADASFWAGSKIKYEISLRNAFGETPRRETTVKVCFGERPIPSRQTASLLSAAAGSQCNTHSSSTSGRLHGVLTGTSNDAGDSGNNVRYRLQVTFFTAISTDMLRSRVAVGPMVLLTKQGETKFPPQPLPSVTEGDFTLGILHDMSTTANWAVEVYTNYLLALHQVNSDPDVLPGHYLGYTMVNTKAEAATAEMQTKKMLRARPENNLVGLLGPAWTVACPGAAEAATEAMLPLISASSDYIKMANKGTKYSYFFRTTFSKGMSVELAAEYMKVQGWENAIIIASRNDKANTAVNVEVPFTTELFESRDIQLSKHFFYSKTLDLTPTAECGQPEGTYFHPGCSGDICVTIAADTDYGRACGSEADADAAYHQGIDATLRSARATGIRVIIFDLFSEVGSLMAQDLYESAARVNMLNVSQYTWLSYDATSVSLGSPWAAQDGFVLVTDGKTWGDNREESNGESESDADGTGGSKNDGAGEGDSERSLRNSDHSVKSSEMLAHEAVYRQETSPRPNTTLFDPVTGFPDFSYYSTRVSKYSKLWDAEGDGEMNDVYGKFAYDAVWVFARALDAQIKAGVAPYDGAALRARILATDFPMASGYPPSFHPVYQDRMKPNEVYEVQNNGSRMAVLLQQNSAGECIMVANPMHSTRNVSCTRESIEVVARYEQTERLVPDVVDGGGGGCSQVNDSAYADNYPNGLMCDTDSGANTVVDTTPFDGVVSCISSTAVTVTTTVASSGMIAAVATSLTVLSIFMLLFLVKKWKEKRERDKPTDFSAIFEDWQSRTGAKIRRMSVIDVGTERSGGGDGSGDGAGDGDDGDENSGMFEAAENEAVEDSIYSSVMLSQVPREVRRKDVTLGRALGKGAFGEVCKATLDESAHGGVPGYQVAVKCVGGGGDEQELIDEAIIMALVPHHDNVLTLIGVVTRNEPKMLIIPYCEHGELLDYLRKRIGRLDWQEKSTFALQVARGMQWLARYHCVHRDLAARNVLVGSNAVCRVADFGLARKIEIRDGDNDDDDVSASEEDVYISGNLRFPVRWSAPESMLSATFSTSSDCWSYGVLLWEIFTDGATPYPKLKHNEDVIRFVTDRRKTMQKPKCGLGDPCPDPIYTIMTQCWSYDPAGRPSFTEIAKSIVKHQDASKSNPDYQLKKVEHEQKAAKAFQDAGLEPSGGTPPAIVLANRRWSSMTDAVESPSYGSAGDGAARHTQLKDGYGVARSLTRSLVFDESYTDTFVTASNDRRDSFVPPLSLRQISGQEAGRRESTERPLPAIRRNQVAPMPAPASAGSAIYFTKAAVADAGNE